jgi:hypothetical protein
MQAINIGAQRCIAVFTGCLTRSAGLAQQVRHEISASCPGGIATHRLMHKRRRPMANWASRLYALGEFEI